MGTDTAASVLQIDLGAIARNYRLLADRVAPRAKCAAVVKADAYGLGARHIAPVLRRAGCGIFFVAHLSEGIALRPHVGGSAIYVLNGVLSGTEADYSAHQLTPVLNSLGEIDLWRQYASRSDKSLPAAVHLDSGMSRLGLPDDELDVLAAQPDRLRGIEIRHVLSHLACADETDQPLNRTQLENFLRQRRQLPAAPASFANSSGIFLDPAFHFELVRPGIALYGGNPQPGKPNVMSEVVRLDARILQVRQIDSPQTVGYGASHRASTMTRIATVPVGYADGYLRSLSNRADARIGQYRVPLVGRVSMDLITLDITAVPPEECGPGTMVTLIGGDLSIDEVANKAGTISYELLTRLGPRFERVYHAGKTPA